MSCMAHYTKNRNLSSTSVVSEIALDHPSFGCARDSPCGTHLGPQIRTTLGQLPRRIIFVAPFIPVSSAPPHPPLLAEVFPPFFHRLPFFRPPPPAIPHSKSTSGLAPRHHSADRWGSGRKSKVNFEMNSGMNFEVKFEMNFKVKKK